MAKNTPTLEIVDFVEQQILPRYADFDKAHNMEHITRVIRHALALADVTGVDVDMVYVIAAYHDLGMSGPRAVHHITGGRILAQDARLRKWFSPTQIQTMKEAVEDHRASASHVPRSIYGKIIAEADRDLAPETVFKRTVLYGLSNYPEMSREQQWNRFREHVRSKYGEGGYIRLWLPNSPNQVFLKNLRGIIADETALRRQFDFYFDSENPAAG